MIILTERETIWLAELLRKPRQRNENFILAAARYKKQVD